MQLGEVDASEPNAPQPSIALNLVGPDVNGLQLSAVHQWTDEISQVGNHTVSRHLHSQGPAFKEP